MKFSDKVVATVNVPLKLTEQDIETIIVGSFEGGSNAWLVVDNTTPVWTDKPKGVPVSSWAAHLLLQGKEVILQDVEDEFEPVKLTLKKLLKGVRLHNVLYPKYSDKNNWDADAYDIIVQCAVFGKVVYA